MYCSNCGKKLEKDYKFCPKCGNKIETLEEVKDDNYEEIKKYVVETGKTSIACVQKEFNISYAKAKSMIERLEKDGVIGYLDGSKNRVVLPLKEKEENKRAEEKIKDTVENIMNTPDETESFERSEIKNNTFLAILSYLGFLALIPYFYNNDSKYVKYHATQGMNLLLVWVIYSIAENLLRFVKLNEVVFSVNENLRAVRSVTPFWISMPMALIGVVLIIITIIGIVYACTGKAKELPLINKIKIIK